MTLDPDGEFWHIVIGAVVGGVLNVVQNWDTIKEKGFWEGAKYFGVGAASGAVTAATGNPALGAAVGGAISGLGNGLIQGQSGWELVGSTFTGAASSLAGYGIGKAIAPTINKHVVNKLTAKITNPYLKNAIGYGTGGFLGGGITGGTLSWATGGSFGEGFKQGAFSGTISGVSSGLLQAHNEVKLHKQNLEAEKALQKELKNNDKNKLVLLSERKAGHLVPWEEMSAKQQKAFKHSYGKHKDELGLPNFRESKAGHYQEIFNARVTEIRTAGTKQGFFKTSEWVNGKMTPVYRSNPIINGVRYYYYETSNGQFVSAGAYPH